MYKHFIVAALSCTFLFVGAVAQAQSPVTESFDSYPSTGWTTFGEGAQNFFFTDGSNGECVKNGCIVADDNSFSAPRIYKTGPTLAGGAFTVHAKAAASPFSEPSPIISLCKPGQECSDGTRLDFGGALIDGAWHKYLVMWREGVSAVELCTLRDSLNESACAWSESPYATGTSFNGIALWSSNGFRSEGGANLWYDELAPAVTIKLSSSAPELSNAATIPVEATFSAPVTGFEEGDITVTNGSAQNFIEVSPDTYTFDVHPTGDGLVLVEVFAGSATDTNGNPTVGSLALERTIDTTGPALTIDNKTTNDLSPVLTGTVAVEDTTTVAVTVQSIVYPADITPEGTWSATVPEGALGDGTYTTLAQATDSLGNVSEATGSLVIDRTAPNLVITGGPAEGSYTNQHSVTFGISSDSPVVCSLDDSTPTACSGSFSASGLESGTHMFVAESTDAVGNVAHKTRTWHVDTAAPIVSEVHAVATPSEDTTPDYIFNTTKAGTITYGGSCSSATTAAIVGDNTITFNVLVPGTYTNCTVQVTDTTGNVSEPLAVSSFTISTPPPAETTVTLSASADTYLRKGASDTNEGASPIIRIRAAGDNRGLVKFDQAAIAAAVGSGTLVSASLEFTIEEAKNNWGKQGREVSAHRLLMNWIEGNGKNGELPGNQSFRGTGAGSTWECAKDTNITNHKRDCAAADDWEMRLKKTNPSERPWAATKSDSTFIQKRQQGVVAFNVTEDVKKFVAGTATNYGWIIKKDEENRAGYVTFQSKESAGAAPELILTVRH